MDELEWGLQRIQGEGGGRRYYGMCEVFGSWRDPPPNRFSRFWAWLTRVIKRR